MNKMSLKEFRDLGLVQEINRCVLHPMGLAMVFNIDDSGEVAFEGINDHRDDPEGIIFADGMLVKEKTLKALDLWHKKQVTRVSQFGWHTQPVPGLTESSPELF
jgi:hypothetical protein